MWIPIACFIFTHSLTSICFGWFDFGDNALDQRHVVVAVLRAGTALNVQHPQLFVSMVLSQYLLHNVDIFTEFTDFSVYGLHFDLAVHQHVDGLFERAKFTSGSDKVAFSNEMIFSMPFPTHGGRAHKKCWSRRVVVLFSFSSKNVKNSGKNYANFRVWFSSCFQVDHDGNLKIRATLRQQRNDSLNRSSANAPHSAIAPTLKWHPRTLSQLCSHEIYAIVEIPFWPFLSGVCRSARQHLSTEASRLNEFFSESVYRATNCILNYNFYNFCSNRLFSLAADAIWLCFLSSSTLPFIVVVWKL